MSGPMPEAQSIDEKPTREYWMPQKGESIQEYYERFASVYTEAVSSGGAAEMHCTPVIVSMAIERWPRATDGTTTAANVLDVGCGTGLVASTLMRTMCELTDHVKSQSKLCGMDQASEMLKQAHKTGAYTSTLQHDIQTSPWPIEPNWADLVVCNGVIIYLDMPEVLDEFVRVTKPHGHILIMIREDQDQTWTAKREAMVASGQWKLSDVTNAFPNFPQNPEEPGMCRIWTYQKL